MTPTTPTPSTSSSKPAWTEQDLSDNPHERADKAERVRSMFAAIAQSYDLNNRLHSFGRDQAWRRQAVKLAEINPQDHVLDVACGTGDLAEAFALAGAERVIGLDFTEPMLEIARHKAARDQSPAPLKAIEYRQGDAMDLPFDDASFDIVSIAFGIRNVSEPPRALAEFFRVLRPGGRLIVLEFSEPKNRMIRALNRFYCHQVMPRTASWIARDRSGAYRYLPRSVETFLTREAMTERMQQAGFREIAQHPMTFGVCVCYRGVVPQPAT